MIRVSVPIDLHAVARNRCAAFALATPLRIRDLLALAIRQAVGRRAPADAFARSLHRTLDGLASGHYVIDVDGRSFSDAEAVVVCASRTELRFYLGARPGARVISRPQP